MFAFTLIAQKAQDIIGKVDQPLGVAAYNAGAPSGIGLILFISNLIKIATIIAGVWVLFNFISAGYLYITSEGDSSAANKVKDQITSSVIGLVIIVMSYTVIAVISYFLFGNAGYILNPVLPTV
jgi:hypothetical protein